MEKGSMLYLKDYNHLNDLVAAKEESPPVLNLELKSLLGKTITVFVDSGGKSGNGFTGILTEVLPDRIRLITSIPGRPVNQFSGNRQTPKQGTAAVILRDHITAITFSYP
jgi:hypothetical protein